MLKDIEDGSVIIPQETLPPSHSPSVAAVCEATPLLMGSICSNSSPRSKCRSVLAVAAGLCSAVAVAASITGNANSVIQGSALASIASPTTTGREELQNLYCHGPLLDAVQRSELFVDSKYFVDMPVKIKSSVQQILLEFQRDIQPIVGASPTSLTAKATLQDFLNKHFDEPGSEIQKTVPSDFTESPAPPAISKITNPEYRTWALALHRLWKELGRSPRRDIISSFLHSAPLPSLNDTQASSLIVVPGGRFRESYYWDSYWIVHGLLVSNMPKTARRVVQNLLEYVAEFGFVPNGGRVYYLTRSQPPLLSDMVRLVAANNTRVSQPQHTGAWDFEYLKVAVPILAKEYQYWMETHNVSVTIDEVSFTLNRYTANADAPRPESYREDVRLAETTFPHNPTQQKHFYNDVIAAAESGWDFSSRWFRDHKNLATIDTRDIVPVDLNAIMYRVESNLAEFYDALGDTLASRRFLNAASARARAMDVVFWHEDSNSWRDYLRSSASHSPVVSASNYFPLWAGSFAKDDHNRLNRIVESLRHSGLIQVAGVQTTTLPTGQQWDAPNAWPPLQDILIEGLLRMNTAKSRELAKELVVKWIHTSHAAWKVTGLMFEKYNATVVGGVGSGGEYVPQFGFGWTNGVVLKFLTKYQDWL